MGRNQQFFMIPRHVFEETLWSSLTLPAKAILPVLYRYMNKEKLAWPNQNTICEKSGVKDRHTVSKAAINLEKQGLISLGRTKFNPAGPHLTTYRRILTDNHEMYGSDYFISFYFEIIDSGVWAKCTLTAKALYPVLRNIAKLYGNEETDYGKGWIQDDDIEHHLKTRTWDIVRRAHYKSAQNLAALAGISQRAVKPAIDNLADVGLVATMPDVKGAFKVITRFEQEGG